MNLIKELTIFIISMTMLLFILAGLIGGFQYFWDSGMDKGCYGYTKSQFDKGDVPIKCLSN